MYQIFPYHLIPAISYELVSTTVMLKHRMLPPSLPFDAEHKDILTTVVLAHRRRNDSSTGESRHTGCRINFENENWACTQVASEINIIQ